MDGVIISHWKCVVLIREEEGFSFSFSKKQMSKHQSSCLFIYFYIMKPSESPPSI